MSKYWMSLIGFSPTSTTLSSLSRNLTYSCHIPSIFKGFSWELTLYHQHTQLHRYRSFSPHSIKSQLALILVSLVALMSFYCLLFICLHFQKVYTFWWYFQFMTSFLGYLWRHMWKQKQTTQMYTSYTKRHTHTQALTHLFVMFVTLNMISVLLKYLFLHREAFFGWTSVCCC